MESMFMAGGDGRNLVSANEMTMENNIGMWISSCGGGYIL